MQSGRFPCIRIPLKQCEPVDWVAPLQHYIKNTYQDDPRRHFDSIAAFNRMRQEVLDAQPNTNGRDLIYQYYIQLDHLEHRLIQHYPPPQLEFVWKDAFDFQQKTQSSLAFEKAGIMYNLAAVLGMYGAEVLTNSQVHQQSLNQSPSKIASAASSTDIKYNDVVNQAYYHFQCAAMQFKLIAETFQHAPSFDLRPETNNALCQAMLAQAHECVYIQTMSQKMRSSNVAKVVNQVARAYEKLVELLEQLEGPVPLGWKLLAKTKNKYYLALAQLNAADASTAKKKHGEAVTRYTLAAQHIEQAIKTAKSFTAGIFSTENPVESFYPNEPRELVDACNTLSSKIKTAREEASKDNDLVYHQDEPKIEDLDPINPPGDKHGVTEPKDMGMLYIRDEPEFLHRNLFKNLIPLEVHQHISMYTEEKAKLLRGEVEKSQFSDSELEEMLGFMQVPSCLRKFEETLSNQDPTHPNASLPPRERMVNELSEPGISLSKAAVEIQEREHNYSLKSHIEKLDQARNRAVMDLNNIGDMLDNEQLESDRLADTHKDNSGFSLYPSSTVNVEYRNTLQSYRQSLEKAVKSDKALRNAFTNYVEPYLDAFRQGKEGVRGALSYHIATNLDKESLKVENSETLLDVDQDQPMGLGGHIDAVKATYNKLLHLREERQALTADFKKKVHEDKDDGVIDMLMRSDLRGQHQEDNREKFFAQQLDKFQPFVQRLQGLHNKQVQLCKQLTSEFRSLMELVPAKSIQNQWATAESQKEQFEETLLSAASKYDEIANNVNSGTEFYRKLNEGTMELNAKVRRFVESRAMERSAEIKRAEDNKSLMEQAALKKRLEQYNSTNIGNTGTATAQPNGLPNPLNAGQRAQMNNAGGYTETYRNTSPPTGYSSVGGGYPQQQVPPPPPPPHNPSFDGTHRQQNRYSDISTGQMIDQMASMQLGSVNQGNRTSASYTATAPPLYPTESSSSGVAGAYNQQPPPPRSSDTFSGRYQNPGTQYSSQQQQQQNNYTVYTQAQTYQHQPPLSQQAHVGYTTGTSPYANTSMFDPMSSNISQPMSNPSGIAIQAANPPLLPQHQQQHQQPPPPPQQQVGLVPSSPLQQQSSMVTPYSSSPYVHGVTAYPAQKSPVDNSGPREYASYYGPNAVSSNISHQQQQQQPQNVGLPQVQQNYRNSSIGHVAPTANILSPTHEQTSFIQQPPVTQPPSQSNTGLQHAQQPPYQPQQHQRQQQYTLSQPAVSNVSMGYTAPYQAPAQQHSTYFSSGQSVPPPPPVGQSQPTQSPPYVDQPNLGMISNIAAPQAQPQIQQQGNAGYASQPPAQPQTYQSSTVNQQAIPAQQYQYSQQQQQQPSVNHQRPPMSQTYSGSAVAPDNSWNSQRPPPPQQQQQQPPPPAYPNQQQHRPSVDYTAASNNVSGSGSGLNIHNNTVTGSGYQAQSQHQPQYQAPPVHQQPQQGYHGHAQVQQPQVQMTHQLQAGPAVSSNPGPSGPMQYGNRNSYVAAPQQPQQNAHQSPSYQPNRHHPQQQQQQQQQVPPPPPPPPPHPVQSQGSYQPQPHPQQQQYYQQGSAVPGHSYQQPASGHYQAPPPPPPQQQDSQQPMQQAGQMYSGGTQGQYYQYQPQQQQQFPPPHLQQGGTPNAGIGQPPQQQPGSLMD
ncbi:bck1-like resistance to osmotic shock [Mycoemilia scoparia]|uniref:BRO domain-containing protein 1 n=1 Tax=Mycoemilia scoparia TaxID=417184 RepID=A0A9W8A446_9FUNG|nr:bck1-like resistance to osmotic shock [Mycoemilia scoparia]